jgi:hypothetical protein
MAGSSSSDVTAKPIRLDVRHSFCRNGPILFAGMALCFARCVVMCVAPQRLDDCRPYNAQGLKRA